MTGDDRKKIGLTDAERKDIALAEYKEVADQFRKLTDIRFKLLTYLPLGTVAAAVLVPAKDALVKPAIPAFAFVVTLCIAIYNKRNDQFYDELVKRAAELERELQIEHGSFSNRPKAWLKYGPFLVDHRGPIGWIYMAAASLWAYMFVDALGKDPYWQKLLPSWLMWLKVFVPFVAFICWKQLRSLQKARKKKRREVVERLMEQLLGPKVRALQDEQDKLANAIMVEPILGFDKNKEDDKVMVRRRIICHCNGNEPKRDSRAASTLLAAVIDLPARWIEDVWSGRR